MTVPSDKNTSWKATEKLPKHKDLVIETTRMWGMKTELISDVIGTLRLIKKGLEKHMEKSLGNQNQWTTKNWFISHSSHTKEVFVLKAKFISPVMPNDHGLDPALQEYTADLTARIYIMIIILIIIVMMW